MAVAQTQTPEQAPFVPRFNYKQTRDLINTYNKNPQGYGNLLPIIRNHSQYHNIPFYEGDFSILEAVKQIGGGFVEGFTTLNVMEHPDNEYEAVARSLGHLIGFAPGIISRPTMLLGSALKSQNVMDAAKFLAGKRGLPLMVAEKYITPRARTIAKAALGDKVAGKTGALNTAKNYLLGEEAKHVMEGAFNLGTASAISAWQGGVDDMLQGFFSGALAGGVFRTIGNRINMKDPKAEKYARALAGSLFMGLPATIRGASTPEQIYEYLMGAYFGGSEKPWTESVARKFIKEKYTPAAKKDIVIEQLGDVERVPGWEEVPIEAKPRVKEILYEMKKQTPEQASDMGAALYEMRYGKGSLEKLKADPKRDTETEYAKIIKGVKEEAQKRHLEKVIETETLVDEIIEEKPTRKKVSKKRPWKNIKDPDLEAFLEGKKEDLEKAMYPAGRGVPAKKSQPDPMKEGHNLIDLYKKEIKEIKEEIAIRKKKALKPAKDKKSLDVEKAKENYQKRVSKTFVITTGQEGAGDYVIDLAHRRQIRNVEFTHPGQTPTSAKKSSTVRIPLRREHLGQANEMLAKVEEALKDKGRKVKDKSAYVMEALRRDYNIMKFADKILINAEPHSDIKGSKGMTQNQTELGIQLKKDVYLLSKDGNLWRYDYNKGEFDIMKTGSLFEVPRRMAVFGPKLNPTQKLTLSDSFTAFDKVALKDIIVKKIQDTEEGFDFDDVESFDAGELSRAMLNNKMDGLLRTIIEPELRKVTKDSKELNELVTKHANKAAELVVKYIVPEGGDKTNNKSDLWISEFVKDTGLQLKKEKYNELKRHFRQWLSIRNQGSNVHFTKLDVKIDSEGKATIKEVSVPPADRMFTAGGKRKNVIEAQKPLEDIFMAASKLTEVPKEGIYSYLDHITVNGRDLDLSRFEYILARLKARQIEKELGFNRGEVKIEETIVNERTQETAMDMAKKEKIKIFKEVIDFYDKKQGMHLFGGSNDKDRLMFVKYHPEYGNYKKKAHLVLGDAYGRAAKTNKLMHEDLYGMTQKQLEKATQSIIAYEEAMNGKTIEEMANNPGFIQNAIAGNKRASLITPTGWLADITFLSDPKRHGQGNLRLTQNKKFKGVLVDDVKKVANILGVDANKLIHSTDGAILAPPEVVKALLRDKGAPLSGNEKSIMHIPSKDGTMLLKYMIHAVHPKMGKMMNQYKNKKVPTKMYKVEVHKMMEHKTKTDKTGDKRDVWLVKDLSEVQKQIDSIKKAPGGGTNFPDVWKKTPYKDHYIVKHNAGDDKHVYIEGSSAWNKVKKDYTVDKGRIKGVEYTKDIDALGEGVNFIIYNSSAKQRGNKQVGSYDIEGGKLNLHGSAKDIIEIEPKNIRYNYSVINDGKHMMGYNRNNVYTGITIAKQFLTNLHPDMTGKVSGMQDRIDDIYHELSQKSFDGKKEINDKWYTYKNNPNDKLHQELIDNVDHLGFKELEMIIKSKGNEKLAQDLLFEIMHLNQESLKLLKAEGEISGKEFDSEYKSMSDFRSSIDNIMQHVGALKGENFGLLLGKYTIPYIQKTMDNYLGTRVLNPKVGNAVMARMRPYDPYLQKILPELNKNDEIFYLGDYFKKTPIFTTIKGYEETTLGDLWTIYKRPTTKKAIKDEISEVFEAINIRVPMDSASGAQVMKFKGFTGIEDHGVLMHGRAMEAEGGADLDADEAFIYFGGRKQDGSGQGMKKSWKELYRAQKEEFYEPLSTPKKSTAKQRMDWAANNLSLFKAYEKAYFRAIDLLEKGETNIPKDMLPFDSKQESKWWKKDYTNLLELREDKRRNREEWLIKEIWADEYRPGMQPVSGTFEISPYNLRQFHIIHKNSMEALKAKSKPTLLRTVEEAGKYIKKLYKEQFEKLINDAIMRDAKTKKAGFKIADMKDKYRDELTLSKEQLEKEGLDPIILDWMQNKDGKYPYMKYNPIVRTFAGQQSANSRALMGAVVKMVNHYRSAWSSAIHSEKGISEISSEGLRTHKEKNGKEVKLDEPIKFRWAVIPKPPSKRQRELTQALVRFTSDPSDETGLIGVNMMDKMLKEAYFTSEYQEWNPKKSEWKKAEYIDGKRERLFHRQSRYNDVRNFDSAYFGRNWDMDRAWTPHDKQRMVEPIRDESVYDKGSLTTATLKFANTVKDTDFSINVFDRVNKEAIQKTINDYNNNIEKRQKLEGNAFKDLIGRTYLKETESPQVMFVAGTGIYKNVKLEEMAKDVPALIKLLKKNKINTKGLNEDTSQYEAEQFLRNLVRESSDYFDHALKNMTTFNRISEEYDAAAIEGKPISEKEMTRIIEAHERIKSEYAGGFLERSKLIEPVDGAKTQEELNDTHWMAEIAAKSQGKKVKKPKTFKSTKLSDQVDIDIKIAKFRDSLSSERAKNIFETLLIGSLRTKNYNKYIKDLYKAIPYKFQDVETKRLIKNLRFAGAKTGQSRLAFDSKVISSANILKFLKENSKLFGKSTKEIQQEAKDKKKEIPLEEEVEIKEFKKEVEKFEDVVDEMVKGTDIDTVTGYENLKTPGKLEQFQKDILVELDFNLRHFPDALKKDLNGVLSGIYAEHIDPDGVPKSIDQMNANDFSLINRWFKFQRQGNFHQKFEKKLSALKKMKLKYRNWMQFPKQVTIEQMQHDMKFLPQKGYFIAKDGGVPKRGTLLKPTFYGEVIQKWVDKSLSKADGYSTDRIKEFRNLFKFLHQTPDGDALWRLAVRKRELEQGRQSGEKIYEENWKASKENNSWDKLKNKKFNVTLGKDKYTLTGEQLVNETARRMKPFFKEYEVILKGKPGALDKYRYGWYDSNQTQPKLDYKTFIRDMNKKFEKNEEFDLDIGVDGLMHMARSMTIDLMPITEYIGHGKMKGKKVSIKEYKKLSSKNKALFSPDTDAKADKFRKLKIGNTGTLEGYFPHFFPDRKASLKAMQRDIKELENLPIDERKQAFKKLYLKYKNKLGDWSFADLEMFQKMDSEIFRDVFLDLGEKASALRNVSNLKDIETKRGFQLTRENHDGGWLVEPEVVDTYIRQTMSVYFRQLSNIMSRYTLDQMKKHMTKKWVDTAKPSDKKEARKAVYEWVDFWRRYASESMGNPTIVTKRQMENNESLKYNPYYYFADNIVGEQINGILKKLGWKGKVGGAAIKKKMGKDLTKSVEDLFGINEYDMVRWSNLEGKYQLATLMTHPKTMINNVFGGTMHTFINTGPEYLKKARDIKFLETVVPHWTSMAKVGADVEKLGVMPELTMHEFGMVKEFREGKGKAFVKDLSGKLQDGVKVKDIDFKTMASKYGLGSAMMNVAQKFMSVPERMLRRDAFVAHYIKAWERYGGAFKDPFHPVLVETAKKGVKATQFLYNAPFRPAFSRSGFGKIMSRFQLWSWNAVRFRNDARKMAKLYGFGSDSEAVRKLGRLLATDMFVMALSGVFMYSMFEQVLPAPWNWLQDSSEWLFGDEKERDRAFFGTYPRAIAPLQMVTPPIARLPISAIRQFAEDDYTKLADYYIWTMFPFGRILRDVAHPKSGVIHNPMRIPEKAFGFPLTGLAKESKRIKESETKVPVPGLKPLKY